MSESKIYSFIGLARKAGAVVPGENAVEIAIKNGKAFLVIITNDASDNTRKKVIKLCDTNKINAIEFGMKNSLGEALGREMFSVIAITDRRFSGRIVELINNKVKNDNTAHGGGFFEQTKNS